ncbi:MAG: hypothetical protein WC565_07255 [Parcubacteria group bacterium]
MTRVELVEQLVEQVGKAQWGRVSWRASIGPSCTRIARQLGVIADSGESFDDLASLSATLGDR